MAKNLRFFHVLSRSFLLRTVADLARHWHRKKTHRHARCSQRHAQLFHPFLTPREPGSSLQDKNHLVNHVFSKAAFTTPVGALARELMATFIAAGLQGDKLHALAMRRHKDVQRAYSLGNQGFLELLFTHLQSIPTNLLIYVVAGETYSSTLMANLVVTGTVPLTDFTNPKVHRLASVKAFSLLDAMAARASRMPERAVY